MSIAWLDFGDFRREDAQVSIGKNMLVLIIKNNFFEECFPCEQPGHICDPDTGRCICPPLTQGKECERCSPRTWSYDSYKGCKVRDYLLALVAKIVMIYNNYRLFFSIAIATLEDRCLNSAT